MALRCHILKSDWGKVSWRRSDPLAALQLNSDLIISSAFIHRMSSVLLALHSSKNCTPASTLSKEQQGSQFSSRPPKGTSAADKTDALTFVDSPVSVGGGRPRRWP